jgi:flagellar biosynthetic protein FliR
VDIGPFGVTIFPFMCISLRTIGLLTSSPVLGSRNIPWPVKTGVSLMTAYAIFPMVAKGSVPFVISSYVGAVLAEFGIGMIFGFLASILMSAVEMAGHIIDVEMGLGMANVIDPQFGQSSPLMGAFHNALLFLVFLLINGHHVLINSLVTSFNLMPPGQAFLPDQWAQAGIITISKMLLAALTLSCPVWATSLIVDVTLGIIARSVPQINVFMVGMPLKNLIGLTVLSMSLVFYGSFTESILRSMEELLQGLIGVLAK